MRRAVIAGLGGLLVAIALVGNGAADSRNTSAPAASDQHDPAITFTGTHYLVAWTDLRAPPRPFTAGPPPPPPPAPPPPPPPPPPPRATLFGTRISRAGKPLDAGGLPISTAVADVLSKPALASAGTNSLVVWSHIGAEPPATGIYFSRVSQTGGTLHPAEAPIAVGPYPALYMRSPSVAFDGRNYLAVWAETERYRVTQIVGVRLSPDGSVLDTPRIPIVTGQEAAVAFDGSNYLVVGSVYEYPRSALVAARVSPSGTVLDPGGFTITPSASYAPEFAVAFNGTTYLVAWTAFADSRWFIYGARVTPDGTLLDSTPIGIASGIVDPNYARTVKSPAVASDGARYLVAWADARFGCCSIFGTRIGPDGSVLDPRGIAIATHGREQLEPTIAYDGSNYFVAWTDNRSTTSDIHGARVTPAGRVLDPRGVLLSTERSPVKCRVPRVVGLRLGEARRRLRRAHCSVGRIRRSRSGRPGRVVAQRPRAGTEGRRGYPVRLVVGRR